MPGDSNKFTDLQKWVWERRHFEGQGNGGWCRQKVKLFESVSDKLGDTEALNCYLQMLRNSYLL